MVLSTVVGVTRGIVVIRREGLPVAIALGYPRDCVIYAMRLVMWQSMVICYLLVGHDEIVGYDTACSAF